MFFHSTHLLHRFSDRAFFKAASLAIGSALSLAASAQSNNLCIASPEWGIFITDYGYADTMVDLRTEGDLNFKGREYLSGEWGNAIGYSKDATTVTPVWLEPEFRFPDWTTNSNFSVSTAISAIGTNSSGYPIYQSVISNPDLEVTITSEVLDTGVDNGVMQGMVPASAADNIEFPVVSGRFVFSQNYQYRNISGQTLSNIKIYQMLHSLSAVAALYDNRIYAGVQTGAGPFNLDATHHHDSTLIGKDNENGSFIDPTPCLSESTQLQIPAADVFHYDRLTLHTQVQPSHIDNDYYGNQGIGDNHVIFKPSVGTHINIENDNLNDTDFFDPGDADYPNEPFLGQTFGETSVGDVWVATAQQHDLGSLAVGASTSFNYLLSLKSETIDFRPTARVPVPGYVLLLTFLLFIAIAKASRTATTTIKQ